MKKNKTSIRLITLLLLATDMYLINPAFSADATQYNAVIENLQPKEWKIEDLTPGFLIYNKYPVVSFSEILKNSIVVCNPALKKTDAFKFSCVAKEDITIYMFLYSNPEAEWNSWDKSKAEIKWEISKTDGQKSISQYKNIPYRHFPKGNIVLDYTPPAKPATIPFFIITAKSLVMGKNDTQPSAQVSNFLKFILLPESTGKVTVDGIINSEEWAAVKKESIMLYQTDASKIRTGFILPAEKTEVFLARNSNTFFLAVKAYKNDMNTIRSEIKTNSYSTLWDDESIEIYFDSPRLANNIMHLVVNSPGYCGISKANRETNVQLMVKTSVQKDHWELEIAIPMHQIMNGNVKNDIIGFNMVRNTYLDNKISERTGFATVKSESYKNFAPLFLETRDKIYNKEVQNKLKDELTGANAPKSEMPYNSFGIYPLPKIKKDLNGYIILKDFSITDLARANNTSALLKSELLRKYAFSFPTKAVKEIMIGLIENEEVKKKLTERNLSGALKNDNPDGFILSIRDSGILIAAPNDRGIYYAVRAFLKLADVDTPAGEMPRIKCRDIIDWPDQKFRAFFTHVIGPGWMMRMAKPVAVNDIVFFKKFIFDTIAGARYNAMVFEFNNTYRFKSYPEIAIPNALNESEMKDILQFCRDHYIIPIPGINTPGHAGWLVDRHPEWAELNKKTMCTRNPEALLAVSNIFTEVIELFGGKEKCPYFHIGGDEVRWTLFDNSHKKLRDECPYCKGIPYNKLLLDYINLRHEFFKARGIRMMMWADMFSDLHNGSKFRTTELVRTMPKDIILVPWSGEHDYPAIPGWLQEGFSVLKSSTGYQHNGICDQQMFGYMLNDFTTSVWLSFTYGRASSHNYYFNTSILRYGDLAWNNESAVSNREEGELGRTDYLFRYGNALCYYYNQERFPKQSSKTKILDITKAANSLRKDCFNAGWEYDLSAFHPGITDIAGIEMQVTDQCIVLDEKRLRVSDINLSCRASSVIFLHTAYLPEKKEEAFRNRIRTNGNFSEMPHFNPVACYFVKYSDGSQENIIMRYGLNVGAIRPPLHLRFPYHIRHVLRAQTGNWPEAQDGRDVTPGAPALYQYEWVNPHPEKLIASIDFVSLGTEVIPALAAITIRDVQ